MIIYLIACLILLAANIFLVKKAYPEEDIYLGEILNLTILCFVPVLNIVCSLYSMFMILYDKGVFNIVIFKGK